MVAKFFVPRIEPLFQRHEFERLEVLEQVFLQRERSGLGVVVRPTKRFRDDFVHKAKLFQVIRSDLESLGSGGRGGAILPQD